MNRLIRPLVSGLMVLLAATSVSAGGIHYQVSTSTRFVADGAANLTGLRMNWVYDPEVSSVIIGGRDMSGGALRQLGEDIMADLYSLGYYVQFTANGQPLPIHKVENFSIKLAENSSIQLGMQVDLKQALPVAGKAFRLKLADPDGSAVLAYSGVDRVVLDNGVVGKCTPPTLTAELLEINGHEMDVQTVTVACP